MKEKLKYKKIIDYTFKCECGKEHKLDAYAIAHWTVRLIHTCSCGRKHGLKDGRFWAE